jgi:hypothetical protein
LEGFELLAIIMFFGFSSTIKNSEIFVNVPSKEEKVEIVNPTVIDNTLINPVEKIIVLDLNQSSLENL